jgi:hypothetical protein
MVSDAACRRLRQSKLAISRTLQHHSAITGHIATVKATLHDWSTKLAKFNLACSKFLATVGIGSPSCGWRQIPMTTRLQAGLPIFISNIFGLGNAGRFVRDQRRMQHSPDESKRKETS